MLALSPFMTTYTEPAEIDDLHAAAEELSDRARLAALEGDYDIAERWRRRATHLIRRAAIVRARVESARLARGEEI